jgi:uncharacterized protein (TIGR02145 family)
MKSTILFLALVILTGCSSVLLKYHGKVYKTTLIENQHWMAENLATNRYRNGRKIPFIESPWVWKDLYTPACGYYGNDTVKLRKYGMLYNWYAVEKGKLCPYGWRVASNTDWDLLEKSLGGNQRAGGRMKAAKGWSSKDVSGDDAGFNAMPGGYRLNEDFNEGDAAIWWSSTPVDKEWVLGRRIQYASTEIYTTLNNRQNGFSVRCVSRKKSK